MSENKPAINFNDVYKTGAANTNKSEKTPEKSNYYILVGTEYPNAETDEMEFISLPQAMQLETMQKNKVYGSGDFQERQLRGNDLLEQLIEYGKAELQPGEYKEVQLTVRLYRRKTSQEAVHKRVKFNFLDTKKAA